MRTITRQIKPGILKLTFRKGQNSFSIVFIFVTCAEKGYFRVILVEQLSADCRRMQGKREIHSFTLPITPFRVRYGFTFPHLY